MSQLLAPPAPFSMIREMRGLIELPRLLLRFPELARQPRGHGQPVLILPGYGAGDISTLLLKHYLRLLGYRARGWGLGRNVGDADELLPRILEARRLPGAAQSKQSAPDRLELRRLSCPRAGARARRSRRPSHHSRHPGRGRAEVYGLCPVLSAPRHRSGGPRPGHRSAQSSFPVHTGDRDLFAPRLPWSHGRRALTTTAPTSNTSRCAPPI